MAWELRVFCVPVDDVLLCGVAGSELGCTWRWCWAELREVAAPLQGQRRMGPFSLHRAWGVFSTLPTADQERAWTYQTASGTSEIQTYPWPQV